MDLFYLIQMTTRNKENARSIHTVQQLQPKQRALQNVDFISSRRIHPSNLTHNAIHESSLQTRNLAFESINLLPAVQRPTVIELQAAGNIRTSLGNAVIKLSQLPPSIKLGPQLLDLGSHRVPRDIALDRLRGGSGFLGSGV